MDWEFCEDCGARGLYALCPMCRSLRAAKERLAWPPEPREEGPCQ